MAFSLTALSDAIHDAAALRRIQRLQPAGGPGDKIFPPTYPPIQNSPKGTPPRHVFELRRVPTANGTKGGTEATTKWSVLLDSVQSQANRLEEALREAASEGLPLPFVTVDFRDADLAPLTEISSLEAPHRVYDAILRDSLLDGVPFMQSDAGMRLASAQPTAATALLELSPNCLLFGAWHSQGQGGGLGAKFPRVLVSEVMGIDTPVEEAVANARTGETEPRTTGRRTGSRIDPLGILRSVELYKSAGGAWDTDPTNLGKGAQKKRPSEILHGNIAPSVTPLGVTCAYAEHRSVISLAGLRRLRFGSPERDRAGRALVAALGLVAIAEQDARGYALRSRCDLVCDGRAGPEIVHADGSTQEFSLDRESAANLYRTAYAGAEAAGFQFQSLTLVPQPKLVEIIRRSRELALAGRGTEDQSE